MFIINSASLPYCLKVCLSFCDYARENFDFFSQSRSEWICSNKRRGRKQDYRREPQPPVQNQYSIFILFHFFKEKGKEKKPLTSNEIEPSYLPTLVTHAYARNTQALVK